MKSIISSGTNDSSRGLLPERPEVRPLEHGPAELRPGDALQRRSNRETIVLVATNRWLWFLMVVLAVVLGTAGPASSTRSTVGVNAFVVRGLVSDGSLVGTTVDPNLVNAWGLAASPTGPWWVANENTETSTIYDGTGRRSTRVIAVAGGPTGVVSNGTDGFVVTGGQASAPARFIYACEDGRIRGWAGSVPSSGSTATEVAVDNSGRGAVYRGLTEATAPDGATYLYAADFHNGRIDVFDSKWRPIRWKGAFVDRKIPAWYNEFGIQAIGSRIFVTYAFPAPANGNDAPTGGYVDVFNLGGKLLARIGKMGPLNEPVDVALAPSTFGKFGGDLLVGNFGDGRIGVYQQRLRNRWAYLGALRTPDQRIIEINGLWGLEFGNGASAGPKDSLYFTAGPHTWRGESEEDVRGLFGTIVPTS
jgi:uncharacterized protein (TIGR03118 family)